MAIEKIRVRLLTGGAFAAFFLFGYLDNLKGPAIPPILDELNLSYSLGGTLILAAYFGFLAATIFTGPISDRAGNKAVILLACLGLSSGIVLLTMSTAYGLLAVAMFIFGLGMGSLEVGGNLVIVNLHAANRGRLLNMLAFFYAAGSIISPPLAGWLLETGWTWRSVYQTSLLPIAAIGLYFLVLRYRQPELSDGHHGLSLKLVRKVLSGDTLWFYFVMALYTSAEIGLATWMVTFLQESQAMSVVRSTFFLSLFFITLTLGRFIGSFLVDRLGHLRSLLIASILTVVSLLLGSVTGGASPYFLSLSGLFMAVIFPTVTAVVSLKHPNNTGAILGVLFAFGGIGGMAGPWLTGFASDLLGIHLGFGVPLVLSVAMSATFWYLHHREHQTTLER